jgi:hypothetical protein
LNFIANNLLNIDYQLNINILNFCHVVIINH